MALSKVSSDSMSSSLNLSNKTVTLPAGVGGKILKTQFYTSIDGTTWSSSSWIDLWTNSYTPVSANSTLHFIVSLNFLPEASNTHDVWMDYRSTNGSYYYGFTKASSISGWHQATFSVVYSCPSGGTTAANHRIQVRGNGANVSYWNYNYGAGRARSTILVLESV